ncbi:Do family serine endopeptidase [Phenylobacterium sp.]|jgi:serine protease Do|uniref:Do family serine endopeptidase n=1 Tax=Phenylobacterium sp. TaxID=1871053 RepID=UPI002F945F17
MTSKKTGYILGAVAGAGVMAAAVAGAGMRFPAAHADQPQLIRASTAPIFAPPPGAPMSYADIFEKVSPAVVSIEVESRVDPNRLRRVIPGLPFLVPPDQGGGDGEDEGAPEGGGRTERGQPRMPPARSSGSGFFISPDGYIVTNNHVVENAQSIKVVLKDERELQATVVGRDEATDLAVLKVEGRNFPFVNFENQAKPRVGDWVIAVGNPFGLGGTATAGIVSAYGRDIGDTFIDFIQIDAPINRGNSGGPTFDIYGRVIGVNTAIYSPSGGSVGIGFAIPAEVAENVTKQLIAGRRIERGYIGATIQNVQPEVAEALGMGEQRGAIVSDLVAGGPSARAGLMSGDVITSVNGKNIKTNTDLTREVAKARPGDVLRLEILREGRRRTIEIRSGVRPAESELAVNDNTPGARPRPTPAVPEAARTTVLGLTLAPLDAATRTQLNVPAEVRGVLVTGVDQSSAAGETGLRRGDVIAQVNGRAVTSGQEVSAAVAAAKAAKRENVAIGVVRNGRTVFLALKVSG